MSDRYAYTLGRIARSVRHLLGGGAAIERDVLAMAQLAPLTDGYLPWSTFAMRPQAITAVLNDVVLGQRRHIVECGGGLSTVYIARLLEHHDVGHVTTIDHDRAWLEALERMLGPSLTRRVRLVYAPLERSPLELGAEDWYSTAALDTIDSGIDLLVVDGPPAHDRPLARYPAVPYFWPRLAPGCTIVCDDIRRRGEREVISRWESEKGLSFDRLYRDGGIAITRARFMRS